MLSESADNSEAFFEASFQPILAARLEFELSQRLELSTF